MTNAERQKRYREKRRNAPVTDRHGNEHPAGDCGYLYIIHCVGFPYYKIGVTTGNPQARIQALQVGLPFDLELEYAVQVPDMYQEESLLHEAYKANHMRGEWFNLNPAELEYLKEELVTIRHGYIREPLTPVAVGLKANRVPIPGDWDYEGMNT